MTNFARPAEAEIAVELAEEREADAEHTADRGPTDEEARLADESAEDAENVRKAPQVREHYEEMAERGVDAPGEGQIE